MSENFSIFSLCCDEEELRGLRELDPDPDPDPDQSGTTQPGCGGDRWTGSGGVSYLRDVSDRKSCSACRCSFSNREEQTEHYKLDWHRFNLRRKMAAAAPLTAEEFEKKTGAGDVSSISGSESESEDDGATSGNGAGESSAQTGSPDGRRSCKLLLHNAAGHFLSVFRCVLQGKAGAEQDVVSALKSISHMTLWVILMTGGGHFAGAVFRGKNVLQHKTFHRYTVRAKRGTAQGLRDAHNRSHAPKSAGATLRRHNEAMLAKEIQDLLETWSEQLKESSTIFIRSSSYNRNVFFSGRSPLLSNDARIRPLPFATRRATFKELQRVHEKLSTVQVYVKHADLAAALNSSRKEWKKRDKPAAHTQTPLQTEEDQLSSEQEAEIHLEMLEETIGTLDLRESEIQPPRNRRRKRRRRKEFQQEAGESRNTEADDQEEEDAPPAEQTCQSNRRRSKAQSQKQQEDESAALSIDLQDDWCEYGVRDALFTACKVGDVVALGRLLRHPPADAPETTGSDAREDVFLSLNRPIDSAGFTLLHVSSAAAQAAAIRLLLEAGADPASRDNRGRTPYVVAPDKDTRNAFRKYMGDNPDRHDYSKAQIPAPLTAEIESKKMEKRKAQKALRKQREKEQKEEKRKQELEAEEKKRFASLTDREKRALAAERRLQQQASVLRCWLCGGSLQEKVPFQYLDYSFCSTTCVQAHRKAKAAEGKN